MNAMEQQSNIKGTSVILIVEDNPVNQLLLRKKIEQAGFPSPLSAKNGREAIAAALENSPDLILMDIQLPDMNGNEVIASLRRQKYSGPIMAISADGTKEDMDRSYAAGADGYVTKPIDFAVFFSRIDEFLQAAAVEGNSRQSKAGDEKDSAAASRSKINQSVSAAARNVLIADAQEKLQIISEVLEHADDETQMERIKAIAHEYKGNAGYFGLHELESIARELDAAFKSGERRERLKKLTGRLVAEIEDILAEST
jgi:two-component system sensor histidine kinase/response regulator